METMYDRIKRMTPAEMQSFIYWVYKCGNEDGKMGLEDSPPDGLPSYFGGVTELKKLCPTITYGTTLKRFISKRPTTQN